MVLLLIPLWLRLRFAVDEVVTTLLLNFVAVLLISMLIGLFFSQYRIRR